MTSTATDLQLRGSITFRHLTETELVAWNSETTKTFDGFQFEVDLVENVLRFECWSTDCLYSSRSGKPAFSHTDVSEHVLESLMDEISCDIELLEQDFDIIVWYAGLTRECVDKMRMLTEESIDKGCDTDEQLWPALLDKYAMYDSMTKRLIIHLMRFKIGTLDRQPTYFLFLFYRSLRGVSKIYSVSKSSLQRWINSEPRIPKSRTSKTISSQIKTCIQNALVTNPCMTLNQICGLVSKECNIYRSTSIDKPIKYANRAHLSLRFYQFILIIVAVVLSTTPTQPVFVTPGVGTRMLEAARRFGGVGLYC